VGNPEIETGAFEFTQTFDWPGLLGRFSSSSYTPKPGTPEQQAAVEQLRRLFEEHQQNGTVEFEYQSLSYLGKMTH